MLSPWLRNLNTDFTLKNFFIRFVKVTNNADPDKYKYSGYGIGFDSCWEFSFTYRTIRNNAIIFGADMSSKSLVKDQDKD